MDSFKGTSSSQDIRFGDKEKKLLRTMKFPPSFNQKVRPPHTHTLPCFLVVILSPEEADTGGNPLTRLALTHRSTCARSS